MNHDTSHRTKIILEIRDSLTEGEKDLIKMQLEWICKTQLIPLNKLTIEVEKK